MLTRRKEPGREAERIPVQILLFVFPLIITNMMQVFYNSADMIIIHYAGVSGAVGAIGTTASFLNLLTNILIGTASGACILASRYIGGKESGSLSKLISGIPAFALPVGAVVAGAGLLLTRPVLHLLGAKETVLELAIRYARIFIFGMPFISLTHFCCAVLRAYRDTKRPLAVLISTGFLNILLNLLFVLAFGWGIRGVAAASVLSNAASSAILLMLLFRDPEICSLVPGSSRLRPSLPDPKQFREVLRLGVPTGIQSVLLSLSGMFVQSAIIRINNAAGAGITDIIDGDAAGHSLETFIYYSVNAVHQAAITFVGRSYGARRPDRIRAYQRSCYRIGMLIAVAGASVLLVFWNPLSSLYVSGSLALQTARTRIITTVGPYFLIAFMEVGAGVLKGLSHPSECFFASLFGLGFFRIAWVLLAVHIHPSLVAVYLVYPFSWAVTGLIYYVLIVRIERELDLRQAG